MTEEEEHNNSNNKEISTTRTSRVRIHVGGLGESVTSDDLSNLFSKVGFGFESIDIIRTKARSFAYIDLLLPSSSSSSASSSHNSLLKLFTTYNGCVWKGGRLRFEKAKEHYLDRLKREWAEDSQLPTKCNTLSSNDVNNDVHNKSESPQKPKKDLTSRKKQLRIFFPTLRKLKPIPFSGTGKLKYSFRRVEVPSLPTHFCDCEEHSGAIHTAKEKQIPVLEDQGGGMSKEELDMMSSVMNRLFEMENASGAPHSDNELTSEEDHSVKETDNLQLDESEEYSTADEDGIIINMVSRRKGTAFTNQESKLNKRKPSEEGPTQKVLKKQTRNHEENDTNEPLSAILQGKGSLQAPSNGPGILSRAQLIESQASVKQSGSGVSWSQKSSWRELVGEKSNSSIDISDMLPNISSNKGVAIKADTIRNTNKRGNKKVLKSENQGGQLENLEVEGHVESQHGKLDSSSDKAGRGSAWLHKASWTQLVTNNSSNSFSISQILPGVTYEKQEPVNNIITESRGGENGSTVETGKSESSLDGTMDLMIGRNPDFERTPESSHLIVMGNKTTSALAENKNNSAMKQKDVGVVSTGETHLNKTEDSNTPALTESNNNSVIKQEGARVVATGETRPFMRTEESFKEWATIRAALSGSRKRTSKGK